MNSSEKETSIRSPVDRLRQVICFELFGLVLISPPFVWVSGVGWQESLGLLVTIALVAAVWNALFNTSFDWIEAQVMGVTSDQRGFVLRVIQAISYEVGLAVMTIPLVAWWVGLDWLTALMADLGLMLAYMVYAFVFNVVYDRIFPVVPLRHASSV